MEARLAFPDRSYSRPVFPTVFGSAKDRAFKIPERRFMTRSLQFGLVFAAFAAFIAAMPGCSGSSGVKNSNTASPDLVASEPVGPRQIMDDLGRTIEIKGNIARVVSLAPSVTELVFAAGGGDRLVGVTSFCDFPEEAKNIAKIGDTMNPNMETIVAMKPDIVFVSTASQVEAFTRTLEQNGILVYVTNPTTLDGVLYNIRQIADILGTIEKAEPVIASLRERIGAVWTKTRPVEKVRVFVQLSREPLFTIGKESFLNEPLVKAGAISATADVETAFPRLSKESALALRPDVIILSDSEDNREPNEVFQNSPAVKNGKVYRIDADLISRPGPRLVDALEKLSTMLHPELFEKQDRE
jgi:iron complex transport system substrate-binding protein